MTQSITAPKTAPGEGGLYRRVYVWEKPVRVFHWVNALSITVLFATGLFIAHPILGNSGEAYDNFLMARVRQIHFIAAYVNWRW